MSTSLYFSPFRFATEFPSDIPDQTATVVRIVHAFCGPESNKVDRCAKRVLQSVLKSWPRGLTTRYLITTGGFISFNWPRSVSVADATNASREDLEALKKAAIIACRDFLRPTASKLAKVTKFVSLGADCEHHSDDGHLRTVELVVLFNLRSGKAWVTGKSYPTKAQEKSLIRVNDLSTHFFRNAQDKVLLLGCHDLTMFSNRAFENCDKEGWKAARMKEMRELTERFAPNIVLQHPHTTDTPRTWSTSLGSLKGLLKGAADSNFTFASAGRWCGLNGRPRQPIDDCLRGTAQGDVVTAVVRRLT